MKTNTKLQREVQDAIAWEPLLHAAEIGVTVKDGVVSLTGVVDSYAKKAEAEKAAKKVAGVKALVEDIEVKFPSSWKKTDAEVATEVLNTFKSNYTIPDNNIKIKVEDGWVTLEGQLPWNYQREAAERAVKYLSGVKGVLNKIKIKSELDDTIQKKDIENALKRSSIYDNDIKVSVLGTTVTLKGTANSLYQKEEAGRIAWKTPGIWNVKNELEVNYEYDFY
ncbi:MULTISPECIES: BON domain-containing protein [Chryseobacterium]|uniref:BON domain-containing protein n=2 Tax=Chryseobacterium TaxID=59732 RepID=A0AAD1DRX2_CHRNA|nr:MULTISPECIES: BON domain-containing protein [Chryseobacterium]AZA92912.1 BON domain-containing protein [Chryseobacterium nakagawai]EJL70585.1 putative periplasmic or secreted lipoprotein [Chryseobacterium populi]VEH19530.1 Osmotically-inducible protein Y precursor [Chryseobacterium nakagawai]